MVMVIVIMMVIMVVVVIIMIVIMMMLVIVLFLMTTAAAGLLQFLVEQFLDRGIFTVRFDLFNFERNAEPFRKISFRDREVSRRSESGVEVLMKPEEWWRNHRPLLPVHFHRFVVFEVVLACE